MENEHDFLEMRDGKVVWNAVRDGVKVIAVQGYGCVFHPFLGSEAFGSYEDCIGEERRCSLELCADGLVECGWMRSGNIVGWIIGVKLCEIRVGSIVYAKGFPERVELLVSIKAEGNKIRPLVGIDSYNVGHLDESTILELRQLISDEDITVRNGAVEDVVEGFCIARSVDSGIEDISWNLAETIQLIGSIGAAQCLCEILIDNLRYLCEEIRKSNFYRKLDTMELPGVGSIRVNPIGDPDSAIAPWKSPSSLPLYASK
jgi:hypothetical protein